MKLCHAYFAAKRSWLKLSDLLGVALAVYMPLHAQAEAAPEITPGLKKILAGLPLAESKVKYRA